MSTAVLGLGAMGLPMATRLRGTVEVRAYDPVEQRRELADGEGIATAATPAAAAAGADLLLVAVRDAAQTEAALLGDEGAVSTAAPGAVVVLTSTIGREAVLALDEHLRERGFVVVDAPVSGGAVRAGNGELLILVGAADEPFAAAQPVLNRLGSHVVRAGTAVGDGQTLKTVNQLLCGVHVAVAAEAVALAARLGLDVTATLDTLGSGAAASFMLADRGPRMAEQLTGTPQLRSRVDIFDKDMRLVLDMAAASGLQVPVATAAAGLWRQAMADGLAAEDDSALVRLLLSGDHMDPEQADGRAGTITE